MTVQGGLSEVQIAKHAKIKVFNPPPVFANFNYVAQALPKKDQDFASRILKCLQPTGQLDLN